MRNWNVTILVVFLGQLLFSGTALCAGQIEINDRDIAHAVTLKMQMDEGVSSHLVDVKTEDGVVTLSGSADNILAKERAVKVAQSIKGVRSVIDELEVRAITRPDPDIREDVIDSLKLDPATAKFKIGVQVDKGDVTLTGFVDSYAEKELCADVIKGVKGIKKFGNNIEVSNVIKRVDQEIKADIEDRLRFDVFINNPITVDIKDGRATLKGTVGSVAERSRAENDAWVKGVNSVDVSAIDVQPQASGSMNQDERYSNLPDEKIVKAVKDALSHDPRLWAFEVEVHVNRGEVILTGAVDSFKAKRSAGEDAMNTVGVWRVNNLLSVRPGPGISETESIEWNDAEVNNNVLKALSRDPYLERSKVTFSVLNGKVYLHGSVGTYFEKDQAEDVVSRVKGVVDVENNIKIEQEPGQKTDWEIKRDIERHLFWNPFVNSHNITVSVEGGVATLTGNVNNWFELKRAMKNALDGGARWVINNLDAKHGPDDYKP